MSMYNRIMCNFTNIYNAYKKAHRSKTNDARVIEFDSHKTYNLHQIQTKLKNKDWKSLFQYYQFKIHEPKERDVDALEFEGRIVQHVLCDLILKPFFEKRLTSKNGACRENKGTLYSIKLLKRHMNSHVRKHGNSGAILKMDIKKYFPSIDREILKQKLLIFPDDEIRELLYFIIDSAPGDVGIPIGNQSSQWFALFYLNGFDRIIAEKYSIKEWVRYVDDCIVVSDSKQKLKNLFHELECFLRERCHLLFNPKSQIRKFDRGVSFLGWKYKTRKNNKLVLLISDDKKKARRKTISKTIKMYRKGTIEMADYQTRLLTINSNLSVGNTFRYRVNHKILFENT